MDLTPLREMPEGRLVAGFVILVVLVFALRGTGVLAGDLPGNDSLMRLLQVRGLLEGQAWFDVNQPRLVSPEGGAMHWSRLPDLPLALLILVLEPLLGAGLAERAAVFAWPLILLAGALVAMASVLRKLGAPAWAQLAGLGFFSLSTASLQFIPGRIDHHGLQLVLVLTALAALLAPRFRIRTGVLAGVSVAAMVAVAMESLPHAAGLVTLASVAWIVRGEGEGKRLAAFGASLAVAASALFVFDAPGMGAGARAVCDAFGIFHLAGLLSAGLGLVAIAFLPVAAGGWPVRLALSGGVALLAAASAVALDPACLGSPYAGVSADVMTRWMATVGEARSLPVLLAAAPALATGVFGFALAGLASAVLAVRLSPEGHRLGWSALTGFLVLAIAVTAWQVRGATFSHAFASIACAGLLAAAWPRLAAPGARAALVPGLALGLLLAPSTWQTLGQLAFAKPADPAAAAARAACLSPGEFARLDALPAARILAPIDLGTRILAHTDHAVFAAPYHRNVEGIVLASAVMEASPDKARHILRAAGAELLVSCPALAEEALYARRAPGGLAARLAEGRIPAWLEPASAGREGLGIYTIHADQPPPAT